MPQRVTWEPGWNTGHTLIDTQHQDLLAQCNALADLCQSAVGPSAAAAFDQAFTRLKASVREHFLAETALLAERGYAGLDDLQADGEEFEFLADEIATTANFDRIELQRFLALWCVGHVRSTSEDCADALAGTPPTA